MHFAGQGGPVNYAEARRLFGCAAAQGHADAQNRPAFMPRAGKGGPQDYAEARRLYGAVIEGYTAQLGPGQARGVQRGGHMHQRLAELDAAVRG